MVLAFLYFSILRQLWYTRSTHKYRGVDAIKIRLLAGVLAAFFLLSACGGADGPGGTGTLEALPANNPENAAPSSVAGEVVFAVSRDADPILIEAAQEFARELALRTNGALAARVELTIAPDADLLAGRAGFGLLSKKRQLDFCQSLAVTATPFMYNNFHNFLMRANARNTVRILEFSLREDHGLLPLTAFYQGAHHLLVDFPPGGYQHFEGVDVILSEDADTGAFFSRLVGEEGAVSAFDSDSARLEQFILGEGNAVELSLEIFAEMEEDFPYQVYLIASYHNLTPAWLVADAALMDGLSPRLRAEVAELSAQMASRINAGFYERDRAAFDALDEMPNIAVVHEFSNVRNRIFNTLPPLDEDAGRQERLARDLLGIMRRTAV